MRSEDVASEDVWKRVGLEELRQALGRVTVMTRQFDGALQALPPCDACARAHLLEQIHVASRQLSQEAVSISMLAEALGAAIAAAERSRGYLVAAAPTPCRCQAGPCTCHGES